MANNEESYGPEEGLSEDAFVERRVPDPSQPPPPTVVLEGLLGRSAREGYWRLYFSRELDHYAEFGAEDVLFSEKVPEEQPPLVGLEATRVGLRRDAQIEYTRVESRRVQAEFLGGAIAGGFRAAGTLPPGPQPTPPIPRTMVKAVCGASVFQFCPSWVDACPTLRGLACQQSQVDACPTGFCPAARRPLRTQAFDEACVSGIIACTLPMFCPPDM